MEAISGSRVRLDSKLAACGAALRFGQRGAQDHVQHQRFGGRQRQPAKGAFPNEGALLKLIFLRVKELEKKWGDRPLPNRALVRNQLEMDDAICRRIQALAPD